jgi:magnesium chelatase family protein
MRERVSVARLAQLKRYKVLKGVTCNAHAAGRWIDTYGAVTVDARSMLHDASEKLALTARGYHRVLKVARTIADLDVSVFVEIRHVAEALRYRRPRM